MSGRTFTTLADGRRVRGFRKTLVQRSPRRLPHERPDYTVSVVLTQQHSLKPGWHHGVHGVQIVTPSDVTVTGKSKDWCIGKMRAFLKRLGVLRHEATLTRAERGRNDYVRTVWIETSPAPGRYLEKDEAGVVAMRELPFFFVDPR